MAPIDELLDHYRTLLAQMQDDIKSFESGGWRMGEIRSGTQVDTTAEWVQELKRRMSNLQNIVAAHEGRIAQRS